MRGKRGGCAQKQADGGVDQAKNQIEAGEAKKKTQGWQILVG